MRNGSLSEVEFLKGPQCFVMALEAMLVLVPHAAAHTLDIHVDIYGLFH